VRYNTKTKQTAELLKDGRLYSGTRLSKDGRTFVFSASDGNRTGDLYAADADMKNVRRLTDANPGLKAKRLSRTELISYLDADGTKSYGVLYYPVDYQAGKKYPTVFNVYEQFFDDNFNSTVNLLTNSGYAVMQPSVNLEHGFPGEAWAKGVTAAANKLIEMGVADPDRLGVQGPVHRRRVPGRRPGPARLPHQGRRRPPLHRPDPLGVLATSGRRIRRPLVARTASSQSKWRRSSRFWTFWVPVRGRSSRTTMRRGAL
jgi:hypothetical protein